MIEEKNKILFKGMNDYVFKRIFHNKNTVCYYANILAGLSLKPDEIEVEYNETAMSINSKSQREDILFITPEGVLNLEAQNKNRLPIHSKDGVIDDEEMDKRMIYQNVSIAKSVYKKGEELTENKSVISIWILQYPLPERKVIDEISFCTTITMKRYRMFDIIRFSLPNLKYDDTISNEIKDALGVLNSENLDNYLSSKNSVVKEVASVIDKINKNDIESAKAELAAIKEADRNNDIEARRKSEQLAAELQKKIDEYEKREVDLKKKTEESEQKRIEFEKKAEESEQKRIESEKKAEESEQKRIESEKKAEESEQKRIEFEKKAEESEQKRVESEKKAEESEYIATNTVLNLYKNGMSTEVISGITGLSCDKIEKILKK